MNLFPLNPLTVLLTPLILGAITVTYLLIIIMPFYDIADDQQKGILWSIFKGLVLTGCGTGIYAIGYVFLYDAVERKNKLLTYKTQQFLKKDHKDLMSFKEYWRLTH